MIPPSRHSRLLQEQGNDWTAIRGRHTLQGSEVHRQEEKMTNPIVIAGVSRPKLMLCMASGSGSVKFDSMACFVMSIQNLIQNTVPYEINLLSSITGVDAMRNINAEIFMRSDCTHLLMIDDDMAWSADLPTRMLRENVDILGVPYKRKNIKNERWTVNHPVPDAEVMEGRPYLLKVDSIGTGMMMVSRRVFDKIRPTIETAIMAGDRPAVSLYFRHTLSDKGVMRSEDFSFCELARKNGFDVWAWVDEEIAHIGNYAYTGRYSDVIGPEMKYEGSRLPLKVMLE